jgi:hypothetical protein
MAFLFEVTVISAESRSLVSAVQPPAEHLLVAPMRRLFEADDPVLLSS